MSNDAEMAEGQKLGEQRHDDGLEVSDGQLLKSLRKIHNELRKSVHGIDPLDFPGNLGSNQQQAVGSLRVLFKEFQEKQKRIFSLRENQQEKKDQLEEKQNQLVNLRNKQRKQEGRITNLLHEETLTVDQRENLKALQTTAPNLERDISMKESAFSELEARLQPEILKTEREIDECASALNQHIGRTRAECIDLIKKSHPYIAPGSPAKMSVFYEEANTADQPKQSIKGMLPPGLVNALAKIHVQEQMNLPQEAVNVTNTIMITNIISKWENIIQEKSRKDTVAALKKGMQESQKISRDPSIPHASLEKRYALLEYQQLSIIKEILDRNSPPSDVFEWWNSLLAIATQPGRLDALRSRARVLRPDTTAHFTINSISLNAIDLPTPENLVRWKESASQMETRFAEHIASMIDCIAVKGKNSDELLPQLVHAVCCQYREQVDRSNPEQQAKNEVSEFLKEISPRNHAKAIALIVQAYLLLIDNKQGPLLLQLVSSKKIVYLCGLIESLLAHPTVDQADHVAHSIPTMPNLFFTTLDCPNVTINLMSDALKKKRL